MNAFASPLQAEPTEAPRPNRGRGSSMREWRLLDRIVFLAAWAAGLGLCLVTGAIVVYMGVRGFQYLRPELLVLEAADRRRRQRLRRISRSADRHRGADPDRDRDCAAGGRVQCRVDRRVRPPLLACATGRVLDRDRRRHARHRDRDLRPGDLRARASWVPSPTPLKAVSCSAARSSRPAR